MAMVMKSLTKGFRYLTSIFEQEHEPEMQIGGPTDVKHVAHIGWDGPTASAPSWMDTFKGEGGDNGASPPPQGTRGLSNTSQSPPRPRARGGKRDGAVVGSMDSPKRRGQSVDGSEPQVAKPSRKKKQKGTASSSVSSSKAPTKGKGRVSQTDLSGV